MASQISEALNYLGDSDERFETMMIGGGMLFFAEYVFLFEGPAEVATNVQNVSAVVGPQTPTAPTEVAVATVGLVAVLVPLGFLMAVLECVSDRRERTPSFYPLAVRHWLGLLVRGARAGVALAITGAVLFQVVQVFTYVMQRTMPSGSRQTAWIIPVLDAASFLIIVFVILYVPYILLAVFIMVGRHRDWKTFARRLWVIATFRNATYRSTWVLLIVLLIFNSDVTSFVFEYLLHGNIRLPEAGPGSAIAAFVSFYLLVSIVYLFADAIPGTGKHQSQLHEFM